MTVSPEVFEQEVETYSAVLAGTGLGGRLVVRPGLNCLHQEDPRLVEAVTKHYLYPPSNLPYQFERNPPKTSGDGQVKVRKTVRIV